MRIPMSAPREHFGFVVPAFGPPVSGIVESLAAVNAPRHDVLGSHGLRQSAFDADGAECWSRITCSPGSEAEHDNHTLRFGMYAQLAEYSGRRR